MIKNKVSRRSIIKSSFIGAGAIGTMGLISNAVANQCGFATPKQSLGPFYPIKDQLDKDNDLTYINEGKEIAKGQVIFISGKVLESNYCTPLEDTLVEIWQACESGRYNHPDDTNEAPLDPHFQYWGRSITDKEGNYAFQTILPGAYPATSEWTRPPHIHFRIKKYGFKELITQLYFKGQELNETDLILNALTKEEKDAVIIELKPNSEKFNRLEGEFTVLLKI